MPVNVFSSRTTGINFGVYYGVTENGSSILLYNLSGRSITFDLTNGTAVTSEGETINPSRAIAQNGVYYVPAYPICRYFGLTYSYYSTDYGPLLRIKDGNAVLSDALFLNSAESIMRSQGPTATPRTTPPTAATTAGERGCHPPRWGAAPPRLPPPTATPPWHRRSRRTLRLRRCSPSTWGWRPPPRGTLRPPLTPWTGVGGTAVVFFPADQVAQCADQIRQAAGRGHKVGLIPTGDTAEDQVASVDQGSQVLAAILRQETWFVLGSDEAPDPGGLSLLDPPASPSSRCGMPPPPMRPW